MKNSEHRKDHGLIVVYTTLGILALGAFSLSFSKLCAFAVSGGIAPTLAPVFALVVDGTIVAAICGQVHATRNELTSLVNRFRLVNIGGAVFSVTANVWEFHGTLKEAACAAFGPSALWVISELIMLTALAYDAARVGDTEESDELTPRLHLHRHQHEFRPSVEVDPEIEQDLTGVTEQIEQDLTPSAEQDLTPVIEHRRRQVNTLAEQGVSVAQIARQLNVSRGTVYSDLKGGAQ